MSSQGSRMAYARRWVNTGQVRRGGDQEAHGGRECQRTPISWRVGMLTFAKGQPEIPSKMGGVRQQERPDMGAGGEPIVSADLGLLYPSSPTDHSSAETQPSRSSRSTLKRWEAAKQSSRKQRRPRGGRSALGSRRELRVPGRNDHVRLVATPIRRHLRRRRRSGARRRARGKTISSTSTRARRRGVGSLWSTLTGRTDRRRSTTPQSSIRNAHKR